MLKQKPNLSTPVFFCENCGTEVPENDSQCPRCRKRFAGVKCPKCFFEGSSLQFTNGCPQCHYDPSKPTKKKALARRSTKFKAPARPRRRRFFSSSTLVGIILIAITLVAMLYMI